ncbi:MAG: sensor histidine kinase [Armatimonadota bacterium]
MRFRPNLRLRKAMRLLRHNPRSDAAEDITLLAEELQLKERQLLEAQQVIQQLQAQLEEQSAEVDALRRIGAAVGSAFEVEETLNALVDVALRLTGTESCHIYLLNDTRTELVLRAADEEARPMVGKIRLKIGEGITGWVAREKRYVAVPREAYKDHRFRFFPEMREGEYESMLAVPLLHENEVIGVINVRTHRPHEYTRNQVRILSNIAAQVAGVIERSRRLQQLERRAEQVSTLTEITRQIASNLYLEEILQFLVNMTAQAMGYQVCTVMLVDEDRRELVLKATSSKSQEYLSKPNVPIGESIAGRAVQQGRIITVLDVKEHPQYRFADIAAKEGLCSLACIPLSTKGQTLGVLNCYTERPHYFTEEELNVLVALANQAAVAVEHAKLSLRSAILQEMHHRVKNNLQQIASLLRLQMHYAEGASAKEVLNESLSRILAIATVHDLLSREDLDMVPVKRLTETILFHTQQGLIPPHKHIETRVTGDDFLLPLQQATSFALILNELVQNAVEHGFSDRDNGSITINISEEPDRYRLTVTNDGKPLPESFDPCKTTTLGLRIVDDLARGGLQGTFDLFNCEQGICAQVVFPKESNLKRRRLGHE